MSDKKNLGHNSKKDFLNKPVEHIDIASFDARKIISSMENVVGTFILLENPVDFGAVDHLPVDLVFSLFAPSNAGVEHLKALALVSRTLRESSFCAKLRYNRDSATLYAILTASQDTAVA